MTDANLPPLPDGMRYLSPHLVCDGAADAIDFYVEVFGARELMRLPGPDGRIMHASIEISGSSVLLADESREHGLLGPKSAGDASGWLHLIVPDADALAAKAVAAGATELTPVTEQFWGDRYGMVEDPWGHRWSLATPQDRTMSTDELIAAAAQHVAES
jgi:PhnB protein